MKKIPIFVIILLSTCTHPVLANEPIQLETVTVTGENIERDVFETNTSVNVQTSDVLERSNDTNIQDVFKRTANVVKTGTGVQSFDFSIRGISTDGVGGAGQEGLASIIIDGASATRVQNARGITSLFDVEQIEILRGPQSTNQGKNSLAGAVVVKTKDPEFERSTQAQLKYGSYHTYQTALAHTGPLTDELAYRVVLDHNHSDGFIDNIARGEDDYAANTNTAGRIKLLFEPENSPFRALFGYTAYTADTNNDIESYDTANKNFTSKNPYDSKMESDQQLATLLLQYQVNNAWTLKSVTTYNKFDSDDRNNNYALTLPSDEQAWRATIDQEETSQELRVDYNSTKLQGTIGLFYSDYSELNTRDGIGIVGFTTPIGVQDVDVDFHSPTDIQTIALFTEFDYKLTDKLTATAGFRYEKLKFDLLTQGLITLMPSSFPFRSLTLNGNKDQSVFLPKLALNYALNENQRIGFTYSEGYRPGGVDLDIFGGTGVTEYDSEYTKNYELSYKSKLLNNRLQLNANMFYIDWKDMQTSGSAQIRSGTFNAGKSTVYGAELELTSFVNDNLEVYFNLGYAKTKFDEFVTGGGDNDFGGNEFSNSPQITTAFGAYYDINDFRLGAEASYRSSYYDSIDNSFEVDSMALLNLSATYLYGDDMEFKFFVNNVFDTVKQTRSDTVVEGESLGLLSDPRVYGVSALIRF